MMALRLLNPQGIAGLAVSLCLALLLVVQKVETRHWKKDAARQEQLYRGAQAALAGTEANYRAAADQARAADRTAAERTRAAQTGINERTIHDYQAGVADARAHAERLRIGAQGAADPRAGGGAPMPGLSAPPAGAAQATGQDRLPEADALTATEQAIQLDELIKWVRAQAAVDPNAADRKR